MELIKQLIHNEDWKMVLNGHRIKGTVIDVKPSSALFFLHQEYLG